MDVLERPPRSGALSSWAGFPVLCLLLWVSPFLGGCDGARVGDGAWDHLLTPGPGRFLHISSWDTTGGNRDRYELAPGDSVVLLDLAGPGVIRQLWLTVASSDPHYLRRVSLKMYWDGEESPSVAAPLGDFFGNGFSKTHYTALPMGVSSGGFYAYLPMPFRERARIVAENGTGQVLDAFYFNANVELDVALPDPLATFHAVWNRDPRTTGEKPHRILEAQGAGHLVGVSLNAESYDGSYWFLEGDEIFTVDGEFRGQGTGTEDYFNGGWYFQDGPFAAPYHGVVMMDPEKGRVAAYRWHLPDPVRFQDSIRVELEHGHGNQMVADYATVAYWYQTEPHRPLPTLPEADRRRVLEVKVPPGAAMGDSLKVEEDDSGGRRVWAPAPRGDLYHVWVYPREPDGRPGPPFLAREEATPEVMPEALLEAPRLGAPSEAEGGEPGPAKRSGAGGAGLTGEGPGVRLAIPLRVSPGDPLPLAVHPIPVPTWATRWLVVGPFPNPQRVGTEYSPALDSVFGPESDPDPGREYAAPSGARMRWRSIRGDSTGYVRLNPHFDPNDHVAAYAQSFLFSPSERRVELLLGADDAHQLWVNGQAVSSRQGRNISVADDLVVPVLLKAGWNRVLLKVADLDGGWAFHLRVADPTGELRWSTSPRN